MPSFTESISDNLLFQESFEPEYYQAAPIQRFPVAAYYTDSNTVIIDSGSIGFLASNSFDIGQDVLILARADINITDFATTFEVGLSTVNGFLADEAKEDFSNSFGNDVEVTCFIPYVYNWEGLDVELSGTKIEGNGGLNAFEPSIIAIDITSFDPNTHYFSNALDGLISPSTSYPSRYSPNLTLTIPSSDGPNHFLGIFWSKWQINNPETAGAKIGSRVMTEGRVIAEINYVRAEHASVDNKILAGLFTIEDGSTEINLYHASETGDSVLKQGLILIKFSELSKDSDAVQKISDTSLLEISRPNANVVYSPTNFGNLLVFHDFSFQPYDPDDITVRLSDMLLRDGELIIGRSVSNLISPGLFNGQNAKSRTPKFRYLTDVYRLPTEFVDYAESRFADGQYYNRIDSHILAASQQIRTDYDDGLNFNDDSSATVKFVVSFDEGLTLSEGTTIELGQRNVVNSDESLHLSEHTVVNGPALHISESLTLHDDTTYRFSPFFGLNYDFIKESDEITVSALSPTNISKLSSLTTSKTAGNAGFIISGVPNFFTNQPDEKYISYIEEFWHDSKELAFTPGQAASTTLGRFTHQLIPEKITHVLQWPQSGGSISHRFLWVIDPTSLGIQPVDYYFEENKNKRTLNTIATPYVDESTQFILTKDPEGDGDLDGPALCFHFVKLQWDVDGAAARIFLYRDLFESEYGTNYILRNGGNLVENDYVYNTVWIPFVTLLTGAGNIDEVTTRAISTQKSSIEYLQSNSLLIRLPIFENYAIGNIVDAKPVEPVPATDDIAFTMDNAGNYFVIVAFKYSTANKTVGAGASLTIDGQEIFNFTPSKENKEWFTPIHSGANQQGTTSEVNQFFYIHEGYNPYPTFNGISPTINCHLEIYSDGWIDDITVSDIVFVCFSARKFKNDALVSIEEELQLSETLQTTVKFNPTISEQLELSEDTTTNVSFAVSFDEGLILSDDTIVSSNIFSFSEQLTLSDDTTYFERVHPIIAIDESLVFSEEYTSAKADGFIESLTLDDAFSVTVTFAPSVVDTLLLGEETISYKNPSDFNESLILSDDSSSEFNRLTQITNFDIVIQVS